MCDWAGTFEQAIEGQLLEDDEGLEVEYDMDDLARGDMKSRAEYYQLGINGGWLTRNEARAREGLNPLPELDEPLQPLNMVPAGTEPEPKPTPGGSPAPADDNEGEESDARAQALTIAIAGRVVRKEIAACRKAITKPGQTNVAFAAWLAEFYGAHVNYVVESLLCPMEVAAAWCDRQRAELATALERLGNAPCEHLAAVLDGWEGAAAAELAARCGVQTSAPPVINVNVSVPERAVTVQAPSVTVETPAPVVNVPPAAAPQVTVEVPAPIVNVAAPEVNVAAPSVTVAPASAPSDKGAPYPTETRVTKRDKAGRVEVFETRPLKK